MGLLRFFLAISVVIAHFGTDIDIKLVYGSEAVKAFFIISGFYMSLVLSEKYIGKNDRYLLFLSNRYLRLMPYYFLVLITHYGLDALSMYPNLSFLNLVGDYHLFSINFGVAILVAFTHLFIIGQDLLCFLGLDPITRELFWTSDFMNTTPVLHHMMSNPPTWTLSLELYFYAIAPFLVKKSMKTISVLIFFSVLIRLLISGQANLPIDPWSYRFFPSELMFFLIGIVCYRFYTVLREIKLPVLSGPLVLIGILVLTVFYYTIPLVNELIFLNFDYRPWFYYLAVSCSIPILFKTTKNSTWDRFFGELSFPIYISHSLSNKIVSQFNLSFLSPGLDVIGVTLCISVISIFLFINPIEKWRQRSLILQN
jgi:peptidoglycan/LPS O-acetylase OafA/YrhL